MGYNAHVKLNAENISKLPFVTGQFVYYFRQDGINTCGILYSINPDDYTKAIDKLVGTDQGEIKLGDFVYLMPGSKIPGFKIKDHVKKCGAKITTDINKATIFIGNSNIAENISENHQEKCNSLIFFTRFVNEPTCEEDILTKQEQIFNKTEAYNSLITSETRYTYHTILSKFITNHITDLNYVVQEANRFLTPAAVNIIYNSKLKNLPIINEELLLSQIASSLIIDDSNYNSIKNMLTSDNKEDENTAIQIICNCDIEKSLLYLWKLSHDNYTSIVYNRSKNSKLFIEKSKWSTLSNYNAEKFIVYLKELKLLTKDWCKILINEASKVYKNTLESNMFKMVLVPTQEYFDYVDTTDVFEFNYKNPNIEENDESDE